MPKIIRSRSNKSLDDVLEGTWKIVAKRVIAEPVPRTTYDPPRLGIYDYEVVPHVAKDAPPVVPAAADRQPPIMSFRRV
jgi:hypothetical protein